ncbi:hypothetical protein VTO42DRAFT_5468 [Malbranchea cinnamomea]
MPSDTISPAPQGSGKPKRNKKKKNSARQKDNGADDSRNQNAAEDSGQHAGLTSHSASTGALPNGFENAPDDDEGEASESQHDNPSEVDELEEQTAKISLEDGRSKALANVPSVETNSRFEALVRDRDSLRAEVAELRRSLEQIQSKHDEEMSALQKTLESTRGEKEHAESQFRNLLGKVNTIKAQLGERLKADAEELSQARSQIEDLENQNASLRSELDSKNSQISALEEAGVQRLKELSSLRDRTNLSQQNWVKEREELLEQEAYLRAEFEEAKQAMHNWEILAMEERSIRENLAGKVADLEDQLSTLKADYERATSECNAQAVAVGRLQKALEEIQTARKKELREIVETSDAQIEELKCKLQDAENRAAEANTALKNTEKELQRVLPFEKEVKEKNLLIGKLRHEAVTLNEHLTKALRFLKKGRPEDNVDRHIVTNHFLHFLTLDRADPKKFQVLQLIAALLGWTDEQREQAGLARPGASTTLRVPGSSPVHRTPSSPALASDYFSDTGSNRKESLAELWSNFLEQEAKTVGGRKDSRSGSQPQTPKSLQ